MSAKIGAREVWVTELQLSDGWEPVAFWGRETDARADARWDRTLRVVRYVPETDVYTRLAAWSASQDNWGGSCELLPTGESLICRLKNSKGDCVSGYARAGEPADAIGDALDKWERKVKP
jgi:hypothetical protein